MQLQRQLLVQLLQLATQVAHQQSELDCSLSCMQRRAPAEPQLLLAVAMLHQLHVLHQHQLHVHAHQLHVQLLQLAIPGAHQQSELDCSLSCMRRRAPVALQLQQLPAVAMQLLLPSSLHQLQFPAADATSFLKLRQAASPAKRGR